MLNAYFILLVYWHCFLIKHFHGIEELNEIMTKALLDDKMDFVRLLHNQGVSMKEYLTASRLEELYTKVVLAFLFFNS